MAKILNPASTCLGFLESNISSIYDAYACFLFTRSVIQQADISNKQKKELNQKFLYRWCRVFSPVHTLAFTCDPFHNDKRRNIQLKHGIDFIDLEKDQLASQRHRGLKLLAKDDKDFRELMVYLMKFSLSNGPMLETNKSFCAQLI